jgi:hypothetical protein
MYFFVGCPASAGARGLPSACPMDSIARIKTITATATSRDTFQPSLFRWVKVDEPAFAVCRANPLCVMPEIHGCETSNIFLLLLLALCNEYRHIARLNSTLGVFSGLVSYFLFLHALIRSWNRYMNLQVHQLRSAKLTIDLNIQLRYCR